MKAAALLVAAAGVALAQNLAGIPACATGCLSSAISAAGCSPNDQGCQCGPTSSAIGSLAAICLVGSCNAAALVTAQSVGSSLCAAYSLTATQTMSSSSAATTTSAAATSTVTVTTAPSTSSAAATTTTSAPSSTTTVPATTSTKASTTTTTTVAAVSTSTHPVSTVSAAGAGKLAAGALAAFIGAAVAL